MGEKGAEVPALTPDEVIALRQRLAAGSAAPGSAEPVAGGWFQQGLSDTDLLQEGAPVDRGSMSSPQSGDLDPYKALAVGRPWVLGVQNQVAGERGAEVGQPDGPTLTSREAVTPIDPFQRSGS